MSRLARARTSLFGFAFVLLAIPLWWRFHWSPAPLIVAAQAPGHAGSNDLEVDLIRAGLDAKALAAAGLSANTATVLAQATITHLAANPTALAAADTAYATARRESDRLKRRIESGTGSGEDVASYQTQSAALEAATAQRQAALDAIFNAATAGLTQSQRTTLSTIRANRVLSDAPVEFLTVNRTQVEWVQLRDDLANEHIAVKYSDTLDAHAQTQLATWRAVPAVASAKAGLDTNLAAVTSAITSATSDH